MFSKDFHVHGLLTWLTWRGAWHGNALLLWKCQPIFFCSQETSRVWQRDWKWSENHTCGTLLWKRRRCAGKQRWHRAEWEHERYKTHEEKHWSLSGFPHMMVAKGCAIGAPSVVHIRGVENAEKNPSRQWVVRGNTLFSIHFQGEEVLASQHPRSLP